MRETMTNPEHWSMWSAAAPFPHINSTQDFRQMPDGLDQSDPSAIRQALAEQAADPKGNE